MLFGWLTESRLLDGLLSSAVVFGGVLISGLYAFQCRLIYMPQFPPGSRRHVYRPSAFGFPKEADQEHEILVVDKGHGEGVRLKGFLIRDPRGDSQTTPTIIYFQGNAGNIGHRLPLLARLAEEVVCHYVLISYRGYGHSSGGQPDEAGIRRDAQAILDWTLQQPDLNADRVILFGQSIGGAVAFDLAARNQSRIWAVMVENTFLSLPQLIPHVMPWLGRTLPGWLCHQRWDTEQRLQEIDTELHVLLLSGEQDVLVPPAHMHRLHQLASKHARGTVQLRRLPGDHVNTCAHPDYYSAIKDFIVTISN